MEKIYLYFTLIMTILLLIIAKRVVISNALTAAHLIMRRMPLPSTTLPDYRHRTPDSAGGDDMTVFLIHFLHAIKRPLLHCLVPLALLGLSTAPAFAQWSSTSGKISATHLSHANNFSFRVFLQNGGVNSLSTCNDSFAFINTDNDNYQAKVAALLSAAAQQQRVDLFYTKDVNGWCSIQDFRLIY